MKSFENLYEESEKLSKIINKDNLDEILKKINFELECINLTSDPFKQKECMGRVIYYVSIVSQQKNINIYTALQETLEDLKTEHFDSND